MPQASKSFMKGSKKGTNNAAQAAARDTARAAVIGSAADAVLEELASLPAAPAKEPEPAYEPTKGEVDAYRRSSYRLLVPAA